jgi:hypothetical protein
MKRKIILLFTFILFTNISVAQNYLVTRKLINEKIQDGSFMQKVSTAITGDDYCIDPIEARAKLYLDETKLPADGRMAWWSELVPLRSVPCTGTTKSVCLAGQPAYSSCGAYIYAQGFNNSLTILNRAPLTESFWRGDAAYCPVAPPTSQGVSALRSSISTATVIDSSAFFASLEDNTAADISMNARTASIQATAAATYTGAMNRCGIWPCETSDINSSTYITITRTINVPYTKTYYMGIAGDGGFSFYIGSFHVMTYGIDRSIDAYRIWHIFPIQLGPGIHYLYFKMRGNTGGAGGFGVEFYDNTADEIKAAKSINDLKVMFTTSNTNTVYLCK